MARTSDSYTDKERRGQFFTTSADIQRLMTNLITHDTDASCLEPSAGEGDLVKALEDKGYHDIDAIELDDKIAPVCMTRIRYDSFFDAVANASATYDVILGNPPYVAWKNLEQSQRQNANVLAVKRKGKYPDKVNFYTLFIDRLIDTLADHGEMVLIVPKEWLYATSALPLRTKMMSTGAITHIVNVDEERVFGDAMPPAIMVFRFVKGMRQGTIRVANSAAEGLSGKWTNKSMLTFGSRIGICDNDVMQRLSDGWTPLGTLYTPRVGIVSGADGIYRCDDNQQGTGITRYVTTRGIETFVDPTGHSFDDLCPYARKRLLAHKDTLTHRKIAKFDESNWYQYGAVRNRQHMLSDTERFYVKSRTRDARPFFDAEPYMRQGVCLYSGGILGMFRNDDAPSDMDKADIIAYLNSDIAARTYEAMGITTGTKRTFTPSLVSEVPIPNDVIEGK